jgi:hypothetical protein
LSRDSHEQTRGERRLGCPRGELVRSEVWGIFARSADTRVVHCRDSASRLRVIPALYSEGNHTAQERLGCPYPEGESVRSKTPPTPLKGGWDGRMVVV